MTATTDLGADNEPTAPALPPLVRVAVLVGNEQIDVSLPAAVPLRVVMEDLVALLKIKGSKDFALPAGKAWTLSRTGGDPFTRGTTLDDERVADGDLLVLRHIRGGEQFTPIVEEVSEAVAQFNDIKFADFTATIARRSALAGIVVGATAVSGLLYIAWRGSSWQWWVPLIAGVVGVTGWLVAVTLGSRASVLTPVRYSLFVGSLPLLMCAGITATPALDLPRSAGGPNLLLGSVVTFTAAIGFRWLTHCATTVVTAVSTVMVVIGAAAALSMVTAMSVHAVGAAVVLLAVVGLTNAPKMTIRLARVRPPELPTPGDPVRDDTLGETFRPAASDDEVDEMAANRQLERRARTANKYLTGLIGALASCLSVASIAAIDPHTFHAVPAIVLSAVITALLFLRARSYVDRVQSLILYCASVVAGVGSAAVVVASYSSPQAQASAVLAVLAAMGVAVMAALKGPGSRMSPPVKKTIEIAEYLLICVSLPLALWVTGVYGLLRDL